MSRPTPLIIVGDAPTQPSGLARIARDIAALAADLPEVELHFVGWEPASGSWAGWSDNYPLWRFSDTRRWGAGLVEHVRAVIRAMGNGEPGVVWPIWDAQRAYELMMPGDQRFGGVGEALSMDWQLWLYPAVDAVDRLGTFRGPAGQAVRRADRVVAYGDWAAGILTEVRRTAVDAIPHFLAAGWYGPPTYTPDPGEVRLGCVATNQPRKDLDLFMQVLVELRRAVPDATGWLHTDALQRHWDVPQLLRQYNLVGAVEVTTPGPHTSDGWLRAMYDRCRATLAVGRGEGFGYPILESQARGVPCIGVDYAGGAELIPAEWRVTPATLVNEGGGYNLLRPILYAPAVADRILAAVADSGSAEQARAWAAGYHYDAVAPRWQEWIQQGIDQIRGRR